jgi:hypothetical protein
VAGRRVPGGGDAVTAGGSSLGISVEDTLNRKASGRKGEPPNDDQQDRERLKPTPEGEQPERERLKPTPEANSRNESD